MEPQCNVSSLDSIENLLVLLTVPTERPPFVHLLHFRRFRRLLRADLLPQDLHRRLQFAVGHGRPRGGKVEKKEGTKIEEKGHFEVPSLFVEMMIVRGRLQVSFLGHYRACRLISMTTNSWIM